MVGNPPHETGETWQAQIHPTTHHPMQPVQKENAGPATPSTIRAHMNKEAGDYRHTPNHTPCSDLQTI